MAHLLMGIATFLVALVPTYASIGIWGAVILTVLRFVQGVGVGGEWGGSVLLSPLIATWLFARYGTPYAIAAYILACAMISLWATWWMPDYTGKPLVEH